MWMRDSKRLQNGGAPGCLSTGGPNQQISRGARYQGAKAPVCPPSARVGGKVEPPRPARRDHLGARVIRKKNKTVLGESKIGLLRPASALPGSGGLFSSNIGKCTVASVSGTMHLGMTTPRLTLGPRTRVATWPRGGGWVLTSSCALCYQ